MSTAIQVETASPGADWDDVVRRDGGQVFASAAYLGLIEEELAGSRPFHLAAHRGDEVVGVMPALILSDSGLGAVANSSPYYGSHGGAYCVLAGAEREECVAGLLDAFRATCDSEGCVVSNVVEPLGNRDAGTYERTLEPWKTDERTGQVVESVSSDGDEMLARYHQKTRNMVRKAFKQGVEVRATTDPQALGFLAEAHAEGMAAIGGTAKSPGFFALVPERFEAGEGWEVYEAFLREERIASLLVLRFGAATEYFTPVTLAEHRSSQPMSLIVHEAMLDSAAKGSTRFNFGGTWESQEGVYRFKSRFGADDVPYRYYVTKYTDAEPFAGRGPEELLGAFEGYYLYPFS